MTDTGIGIGKLDIAISHIGKGIGNLDIGYVGIGQISARIPGYRLKYREIWLKYTLLRKLKISVAVADIWLKISYQFRRKTSTSRIFRYWYRLDPSWLIYTYNTLPDQYMMQVISRFTGEAYEGLKENESIANDKVSCQMKLGTFQEI